MCFGNTTTDTKTTTPAINPMVQDAAANNLNYVNDIASKGFTPYGGQQVANFSPMQDASFNMTNATANNGTGAAATNLIGQYTGTGPSSVAPQTIASQMSPYMNQYVMQALAPQLQQMDWQNAATQQQTDAQATGSGAFGDARTGIQQAQNQQNANVAREGVIGAAYNNAFNTAIGAGAQDVSNNLTGQTTNASLMEQYLQRALGGAGALQGLQNQQLGVAGAVNASGQQQTAQQQAQLTAMYNQYLMAQQYPFQVGQLMNNATATTAQALPSGSTTTDSKPDNSGLSLLGSGLGAAASLLMFSDRDLKENIVQVGAMKDGTPIYTYRYFDDPENVTRVGLMAQDVEKRNPDAVMEAWPGGAKMVDYGKATALSRALALEEAA